MKTNFYGAGLYNCSPFFSKPVMTFCPLSLTSHVANASAISAFGAFSPTRRCAGFSSGSSASSVAALYMVILLATSAGRDRNVPLSVRVYSSSKIAAVSAWIGNAIY